MNLTTEQIAALSNEELVDQFLADLDAFHAGGPNLRTEHLQLARSEGMVAWINALWDEAKPKRKPEKIALAPQIDAGLSVSEKPKSGFVPRIGRPRGVQLPAPIPVVEDRANSETVANPISEGTISRLKATSLETVVDKNLVLAASLQAPSVNENDLLDAMNERHAVVGNVGGKCRVLEWVPSELDEAALIPSFQSKTDFFNRYAHRQIGWKRGEPVSAGEWWFEHPRRADYRGVVFKPGKPAVISRPESGSWLNLWRGWGVVPCKGQWPLLRNHVEQVLSGGDPKMADYIIWWAAWGFQNPGEPAEAASVLRGKKGGGKGVWFGAIRGIYGPHGLQITQSTHLTGNFNAHLWTCAYLWADEAFWAGDKQGEAVLKGLITERPLMVEKKGIDTVQTVSCVKLAMSSNADWVVPASHDERRFAVSDIDPRYAKGVAPEEDRKAYFAPIHRELRDGGAAAMLYDFLQMDLGDWHPREVPITAGLMRQKKQSLRGHFQWLEPLLQSGMLPGNAEGRPNRIRTEALVAHARTFRGLEYASDESIATFLYDEMGFSPEPAPQGNRFRGAKGGARGWEFPPLLELRERWETKFGGQWNWHDPEITEWQKRIGY